LKTHGVFFRMRSQSDLSLVEGKPLWIRPRIKLRFARKPRGRGTVKIAQRDEHGKIVKWYGASTDEEILHAIQGPGGTVLKTNVDLERARLIQSTLAAPSADTSKPDGQ